MPTFMEEFKRAEADIGIVDHNIGKAQEYLEEIYEGHKDQINSWVGFSERQVDKQLHRIYRRFSGVNFADPEDAINKTKGAIKGDFLALVWQSLAAGMIVGSNDARYEGCEDIAENEQFREEVLTSAAVASGDAEVLAETTTIFEEITENIANGSGFLLISKISGGIAAIGFDSEGSPDFTQIAAGTTAKVWDMWKMVMEAGSGVLFCTGYAIGKNRHDDALFAALEQEVSADE